MSLAEPSPIFMPDHWMALDPDIVWSPELEDIWLNETGHYCMEVVPEKPEWGEEE